MSDNIQSLNGRSLNKYEKPLVDSPQESYTLPSYVYTDPEVFEIEKEKICLLYTSPSPRDS